MTKKIEKLKRTLLENPADSELISILNNIKEECDDGIPKRVLAGQCGLHSALTNFLSSNESVEGPLKVAIFETLIALMTGKNYNMLLSSKKNASCLELMLRKKC